MAKFATFDDLTSFRQKLDESQLLKSATASVSGKTIFLSHSSEDKSYLPAVISLLENHGGKVYVDKTDDRLPKSTSRETAEILRSTIGTCRRFVVFVTTNSKESRWIPWELGLADGKKRAHSIALFPVANKSLEQAWAEQEYLGLYQRIVWGIMGDWTEEAWMVLNHAKNTATPLRKWLEGI